MPIATDPAEAAQAAGLRYFPKLQESPGQELFQQVDEIEQRQSVDASDANGYLREVSGQEFSAKDFRTWAGTVPATIALQEFERFDSQAQAKKI